MLILFLTHGSFSRIKTHVHCIWQLVLTVCCSRSPKTFVSSPYIIYFMKIKILTSWLMLLLLLICRPFSRIKPCTRRIWWFILSFLCTRNPANFVSLPRPISVIKIKHYSSRLDLSSSLTCGSVSIMKYSVCCIWKFILSLLFEKNSMSFFHSPRVLSSMKIKKLWQSIDTFIAFGSSLFFKN